MLRQRLPLWRPRRGAIRSEPGDRPAGCRFYCEPRAASEVSLPASCLAPYAEHGTSRVRRDSPATLSRRPQRGLVCGDQVRRRRRVTRLSVAFVDGGHEFAEIRLERLGDGLLAHVSEGSVVDPGGG